MKILGIKVDNLNFKQCLDEICRLIQDKKPHQVVTVNPEMIMHARHDSEFKYALNHSDLNTADGIGVIMASKVLGGNLRERVSGTDLVWKIAEIANRKNYKIYFLGAAQGVAESAAQKIKQKFPELKIVGTDAGSPYDLNVIEKIRNVSPDILFVAFGHPKQEKWIYKYKKRLGVPVSIGVGGAFDFISGRVKRAPLWVQKIGLEWFYRLIKEPRRFKRQLSLPVFSWLVIEEFIKKHIKR